MWLAHARGREKLRICEVFVLMSRVVRQTVSNMSHFES